MMYGKEQEVEYLSLNLLWGSKLYQKLQFVLVKYHGGTAIFVSTDLTLNPILVIEAYAHRFKILYEPCSYTNSQPLMSGIYRIYV